MVRDHSAVSTILAGLLCLAALSVAPGIHAGDEDMSPSAYHVFDPETGYMMTVDPMAEEQLQGDTATDAATPDVAPAAATDTALFSRSWTYLLPALLVIVGVIAWLRRKKASPSAAG